MPTMTIRPMQHADIASLAAWLPDVPLWQRYGLTSAQVRAMLAGGLERSDILLVADAGEVCGLAWCLPHGAFGRSAYLRLLGVHPAHAGQGIGARLLADAEGAAAVSSREIFLLVSDFNTAAQRFYRRHGYSQSGAITGYVLPDVTEYVYWKRLQRADEVLLKEVR